MRKWMLVMAVLAAAAVPGTAAAELGFLVGVHPGSVLYSADVDGYTVADSRITEELQSPLSTLPTLSAGLAWEAEWAYIDLTGGVGYLYNTVFSGFTYGGDLALRFKLPIETLTLGPHIGLIRLKPDWDGDADVSLSDTTGTVAGLGVTVGTRPMSVSVSMDYLDASLDATVDDGSGAAAGDLDLSGAALQVGVIFRF